MASTEHDLVPLRVPHASVPRVDHVRSTLLLSAQGALKDAGLLPRYQRALPPEWRDRILAMPAASWLPIEYAEVHYGTGDALELPTHEILALGGGVARYAEKTLIALAFRVATEAGATPVGVLASMPRFWARAFQGGCVAVRLTGPKDATFQGIGLSLARFRYFRIGFRAFITATLAPFCTKVYLREVPDGCTESRVTYAVSWA